MYRLLCTAFTLLLIYFSSSSLAEDSQTVLNQRQIFEIGISMSIPPWVIKENDSGIELDILRESLGEDKYDIRPVYLPFERAYKLFEGGKLDGVMNSKAELAGAGFLSEPVVVFHNYAISLASKGFPENISMDFLRDKSVVGFQKARHFLGPDYAAMARINPHYQEVPKQDLQINLLFIREVDFIVMDKSIFGYHWYKVNKSLSSKLAAKDFFNKKVTFHSLFEQSPYPFLFKDKQVRDDFNQGLEKIKSNGRYQNIHKSYSHLSDLYQSR